MASLKRKLSALALSIVLFGGGIAAGSPAYATDPAVPPVDKETALTQFRAGLVTRGVAEDVAKFDAFTTQERADLASYLVGEIHLDLAPPADATWDENGVATYGNFEWGLPAETVAEQSLARNSSYDVSIWGTQWFSFLGVKLIEVKNSITYTLTFSSSTGTRPSAIKNHSCMVTLDTDIFAEVTSDKNSSYTDVWQAQGQCKVTVKRGLWVPWGIIVTSSTDGLHTLRGDNMGNVVQNSFTGY